LTFSALVPHRSSHLGIIPSIFFRPAVSLPPLQTSKMCYTGRATFRGGGRQRRNSTYCESKEQSPEAQTFLTKRKRALNRAAVRLHQADAWVMSGKITRPLQPIQLIRPLLTTACKGEEECKVQVCMYNGKKENAVEE